MNIKLIVAYEGTKYSGFQKQGNTGNTIEEKLAACISRLTGEEVEIHGAGRTDAGVHAKGQVVSFHTEKKISTKKVLEDCNRYLPKDIRILSAEPVDGRFHARLNAKKKHYRYTAAVSELYDAMNRRYTSVIPGNYDMSLIEKAAAELCGEMDFASFCDNPKMKKSTVRKIEKIDISVSDAEGNVKYSSGDREKKGYVTGYGDIITLDFYGNGFLYHMVRILAGTLLDTGRISLLEASSDWANLDGLKVRAFAPEDMKRIIEKKNRNAAGMLAPAAGLTLMKVFY